MEDDLELSIVKEELKNYYCTPDEARNNLWRCPYSERCEPGKKYIKLTKKHSKRWTFTGEVFLCSKQHLKEEGAYRNESNLNTDIDVASIKDFSNLKVQKNETYSPRS